MIVCKLCVNDNNKKTPLLKTMIRSGVFKWRLLDSNQRPLACEASFSIPIILIFPDIMRLFILFKTNQTQQKPTYCV